MRQRKKYALPSWRSSTGGDYTGTLHALAGLVLIGLAVKLGAESFRQRTASAEQSANIDS